jgi:pyrroline-5-carboxylate reductase
VPDDDIQLATAPILINRQDLSMAHTLAFIGGGNMARSLIGGLVAQGTAASSIIVADPSASQLETLRSDYSVRTTHVNSEAVADAEVVLLAVKPQQMREVTSGMAASLSDGALIISVAAGITAPAIREWSGGKPVVRCMPNRPALQGCGMTALFATGDVSPSARTIAEQILGAVGATLWVSRETDMDVVTAVSGSGPAYFFLLIEILEQAGMALGLAQDIARKLAIETAYGSGRMAREAHESPTTLREQVTSKGGTTEAALRHLESQNVRAIFADAVTAAARRSAELASEFGAR